MNPISDQRSDPGSDAITEKSADALSQAIHRREVSCREVMQAYLARIHRLNPRFNAIVSLAPDELLLREADQRDAELAQGRSRGWMHGMPQAIKDASDAAGFPTTLGSVLLKDNVAQSDSIMTSRMRAAGCIVVGKTNLPEFGLGSHTFNDVFGATRNAWDPTRSAGGSSGGAAVALAQRLLPVADGSDYMGSLRNPAAWNHVVGFRPSQGRVPNGPASETWISQIGTEGPMGRNVRDVARLLAVQAGHDPRVPLSIAEAPHDFLDEVAPGPHGLRIGWLGDLGGHLAVEPGILEVCTQALQRFSDAGARVEPLCLGFPADAVWQAWVTTRHALSGARIAALLARPRARELMKPEALWEHDQGARLGAFDLMRASEVRTAFHRHLLALFERFDLLALPVAQVWPFDIGQRWPSVVAGRPMDTYHRWMESTIYASFAGLPAISVPAGFDASGRLPMGLQLIGRPQGDAALLSAAAAYEATVGDLLARRPPTPQ